jgi:acetyl esterase/lipase
VQHLVAQAGEYGVDPDRVVLAGDSAGAHIAGELANRAPGRYRGVLLFCGTYDPTRVDDTDRIFAAALETVMWSVTRSRRWRDTAACSSMTVLDRVTADFPATFISAGDLDPLTRNQTVPMVARLTELGVPLEVYTPEEPSYHEFQFQLGTPAATEAFERAVTFLERITSNSH